VLCQWIGRWIVVCRGACGVGSLGRLLGGGWWLCLGAFIYFWVGGVIGVIE